jgi:hypothetical protein
LVLYTDFSFTLFTIAIGIVLFFVRGFAKNLLKLIINLLIFSSGTLLEGFALIVVNYNSV